MGTPALLGLGDLIYDHVFSYRSGHCEYVASRGGGCVFNLLANAASRGVVSIAHGVGGRDGFGESAVDDLVTSGVDAGGIQLLASRRTRLIFECIQPSNRRFDSGDLHEFATKCLICEREPDDRLVAALSRRKVIRPSDLPDVRILCLDQFTRNRLVIARELQARGVLTVLDLGRLGHLRYWPAPRVVASLNAFDVVQMPERVAHSLQRRAQLGSLKDLCRVGPRFALCVTRGRDGLTLLCRHGADGVESTELPGLRDAVVVDDAGAGDAFLASFLVAIAGADGAGARRGQSSDLHFVREKALAAIAGLPDVLATPGARGHLQAPPETTSAVPVSWRGKAVEEIRASWNHKGPCPFCGTNDVTFATPLRQSSPRGWVASRNLQFLVRRVFKVMEQQKALEHCREFLSPAGKGDCTAYVVGTGGSYPVAVFVSLLLTHSGSVFAQPARPFDYIRLGRTTDYLVVISHSGATPDCREAIAHAKTIGVRKIAVVTAPRDPTLADSLRPQQDVIVSYNTASKPGKRAIERGFVSIAGTVVPCALWAAAALTIDKVADLVRRFEAYDESGLRHRLRELRDPVGRDTRVAVFGGGWAWPAMVDIESKFTEADLGSVQLHEVKDFSHGRFNSVLGRRDRQLVAVCLTAGGPHPYEEALLSALAKDEREVIRVPSCFTGVLGALDLLVQVQYLAHYWGQSLGTDISRPGPPPQAGIRLYRWNRKLSSTRGDQRRG